MRALELRKDDFYVATLEILNDLGGSGSIEEIEGALIQRFAFSIDELDRTYESSGSAMLTDKMSWARSYLKTAGLLSNETRGVWVLTEAGRAAAAGGQAEVVRAVRDSRRASRTARRRAKHGKDGVLADVNEDATSEEREGEWSDRLLDRLQSIAPAGFERLCQRLLREYGFTRVNVTGKSGDGGIDGQGVLRVNLVSFHVIFQCKRYSGSVGAGAIRDFRGAMQGRADKGLVITTGNFTPEARREATRDGAPAIDLIDGDSLCELLREKELGVVVRRVTTFEIDIDEDFLATI